MAGGIVQANSTGATTSATTKALAFAAACQQDNAIILCVTTTGTGTAADTLSSSPSLTWTKLREHVANATSPDVNVHTAIWVAYAATAATYTMTYTPNASAFVSLEIAEVTGLVVSGEDTGAEGHNTAAASPMVSGNSATLAHASEFVVGVWGANGGQVPTSFAYGSYTVWPCTQFIDASVAWSVVCEYKVVSATTAVASSFTAVGASPTLWDTLVQTFDATGGGFVANPTYVGAGTAAFSATSGATITPGLPTGWAANDIHVLLFATSDNTDMATPSGWTELIPGGVAQNNTIAHRVEVYWRRAVAGDTAPGLVQTGTAVRGAQIYGIRGCVATVDPFSNSSRLNNAASATVSTTATTPNDDHTLGLFLYAYEDDPTAASQPTNWSTFAVATSSLGNDMALGVSTITLTTASSQNPSTTVSGGTFANSVNEGILLFLRANVPSDVAPQPASWNYRHLIVR